MRIGDDCAPGQFALLARLAALGRLKERSYRKSIHMANQLVNYLRAQRKNAGLSQKDLAQILGYDNAVPVSRHELFRSVPPLIMAFAYEIIFQIPASELFGGLREAVESAVEKQIVEFEARLLGQKDNRNVRRSSADRRKLEWVRARRKTTSR